MSNSKKEGVSVIVGNYTFIFSAQKMIVTPRLRHNKSEKELRAIARAYKEYRYAMGSVGRPLAGKWRWCANPKCRNIFYARRSKIEAGEGSYCSHRCAARVSGFKKEKRHLSRGN